MIIISNKLSGNDLVNLIVLTTNIDKSLVFQKCAQEETLQMKIDQKNLTYYYEAYYESSLAGEDKGTRKLHHDLKKGLTSKTFHETSFNVTISENINIIGPTIVFNLSSNKQDKHYSTHI